jgi:hypothetical protein
MRRPGGWPGFSPEFKVIRRVKDLAVGKASFQPFQVFLFNSVKVAIIAILASFRGVRDD